MNMSDQNDFKLEEAFEKLDEMLDVLESPDISLEESFEVYKEGMTLLTKCNETIDQVEKKVLKLTEEGKLEEL
ncbi:MAG: exodeoxyribonuclease VII small subunit [Clostridia bacterium]|nr:exodeoxyribonuclease VII small subunit [Clostridia bacterium]